MDFSSEVINWYIIHKRNLPWRNSNDPYVIWLSEIILQQTRVEQGMPYFYRFLEKYPTVEQFAAASEDEILNLWQGLGYYSRGRNMHFTANQVMEKHSGIFPKSYHQLIELKGVGEYTAAAIASFAGDEPKAVVDGNVFRLLSRYYGIDEPINSSKGKKVFTELANLVMDQSRPGTYNQAVMEFGSLQCKPKNPDCPTCPLQPGCFAFANKLVDKLPVKLKLQKVRDRYFNYFVLIKDDEIVLNRRTYKDIWQNLHELPLIETPEPVIADELINSAEVSALFGCHVRVESVNKPAVHLLSHQRIHALFIEISNFEDKFLITKPWFYADLQKLDELAQPKLIFAFLKNFFNLKVKSIIP